MRMRINNAEKIARTATIATLALMVCWGTILVFLHVKPFWRDEWCIIYNLKFKTPHMLWGPLDFVQQFPRVYLEIIKWFTGSLDYSYFSLRFPAYLIATTSVFFSYALMKKAFPQKPLSRYLLPLVLVSDQVFMDYYVQIKHYEMEILLGLVAIWQLLELLRIPGNGIRSRGRYLLLCAGFAVFPFFSYTYPIALFPVFILVFMQGAGILKNNNDIKVKKQNLLLQWLPLALCVCSIVLFYIIDVSQLMADKNMHMYWENRLKGHKNLWDSVFVNIWYLFAKAGSGFVFEIIFGILGLAAFFSALFKAGKNLNTATYDNDSWLKWYSIVLLTVVVVLFLTGKLPVGEAKFNAFAVSSISILIIFFMDRLQQSPPYKKFAMGLLTLLFLGLIGNVVSGFLNMFTSSEYAKRIDIYNSTENAIKLAYAKKLPVLVTAQVGFPDDINAKVKFISMPDAAGVLKTFPAYQATDTLAVYSIHSLSDVNGYREKLPAQTTAVLVADGTTVRIINL
jgi:hypothetical protein